MQLEILMKMWPDRSYILMRTFPFWVAAKISHNIITRQTWCKCRPWQLLESKTKKPLPGRCRYDLAERWSHRIHVLNYMYPIQSNLPSIMSNINVWPLSAGGIRFAQLLSYIRRVSEIIFTCSYDRYRSIYTGGGCWERIDLELCTSSNHHQRIWNYIYHRSG